jgi:hypothetical protein
MRVSQAGKKLNMSHEQTVETGGAEEDCFLSEEEGTVRVGETWEKKVTIRI